MPAVRVSRRSVLQGAAAGVAATLGFAVTGAPPAAAEVAAGLGLSSDFVLHALRRTTFGPTPELVAHVRGVGWTSWVDAQLACDPAADSDATWTALAKNFPTLGMSALDVHRTYEKWPSWAKRDTEGGVVVRPAYSVWQLREVMVEFWANHFHTSLGGMDNLLVWTKSTEDREVISRHALGKFSDLLLASAQSPAMIQFLDNIANGAGGQINENYARELLELHTIGADAFYARGGVPDPAAAEADVQAAARVLSGWWADFTWKPSKGVWGDHLYHFKQDNHLAADAGPVFGWPAAGESLPPAGEARGISLLNYLARHPATAQHLCRKLCAHFVDDEPPASVVSRAVAAYQGSDTSIAATVRAILLSPEFAAASGTKWRRPVEAVLAMVRALGMVYDPSATNDWTEFYIDPATNLPHYEYHAGPSSGGQTISNLLATLDQKPFAHRTPDGFPFEPEAWIHAGGLLRRWNAAVSLTVAKPHANFGFQAVKPTALAGGLTRPTLAGAVVDALTQRLCCQQLDPAHRGALLSVLGKTELASVSNEELDGVKGRQVVALILSSAYFQLR